MDSEELNKIKDYIEDLMAMNADLLRRVHFLEEQVENYQKNYSKFFWISTEDFRSFCADLKILEKRVDKLDPAVKQSHK